MAGLLTTEMLHRSADSGYAQVLRCTLRRTAQARPSYTRYGSTEPGAELTYDCGTVDCWTRSSTSAPPDARLRRAAAALCQGEPVQEELALPGLHPLLATRWSPTTFDASHDVEPPDVALLLEAARWAPSAGNSQPWAFIVGRRGSTLHRRLVRHLAESSARWAPSASLLVANLAHRYVEDTDWDYSEFALYDLGQAVAHMTLQAQGLGLSVRQFRAFDRPGLAADFDVPAHWEVATMSAVGRVPPPADEQSAARPGRQRRTVEEIVWPHA